VTATSGASPLEQALARRLIPVVVIDDAARAAPLAEALVAGGLPVAEVTYRTAAADAAIRAMAGNAQMVVGAGTVTSREQVDRAVESGAQFVVSPGLSADVVRRCSELGVPVVPGVSTPTEIMASLDLGIETVKFFPAEAMGGAPTVRALAAPFPQVRFVPTGGVGPDNMAEYLRLPSVAAVGGSWMVSPALLPEADFAEVSLRAAAAVASVEGAG
jgi:2-dehydro-3-deoxyphosphogluconate aldolase / (4S)-4-hydroxy-2-oxoglutarate aldolase